MKQGVPGRILASASTSQTFGVRGLKSTSNSAFAPSLVIFLRHTTASPQFSTVANVAALGQAPEDVY